MTLLLPSLRNQDLHKKKPGNWGLEIIRRCASPKTGPVFCRRRVPEESVQGGSELLPVYLTSFRVLVQRFSYFNVYMNHLAILLKYRH